MGALEHVDAARTTITYVSKGSEPFAATTVGRGNKTNISLSMDLSTTDIVVTSGVGTK